MLLWPNETRRNGDIGSMFRGPIAYISVCLTTDLCLCVFGVFLLVVVLRYMCHPLLLCVYTEDLHQWCAPKRLHQSSNEDHNKCSFFLLPSERLLISKAHTENISKRAFVDTPSEGKHGQDKRYNNTWQKPPVRGVWIHIIRNGFNTHPHTTPYSRCFFSRCPVLFQWWR